MKLFLVNIHGNKLPSVPFISMDDVSVHTLTDTALLGKKCPFFVPDFAEYCMAQMYVAFRICRLGRSISERFANRYYDAITSAVHFSAHPLFEDLRAKNKPWDLAMGFDGALAVGEFKRINDFSEPGQVIPMSLYRNDVKLQDFSFSEEALRTLDRLIAYVSGFYTLRQGDILMYNKAEAVSYQVDIDDHLTLRFGPEVLLEFNVK